MMEKTGKFLDGSSEKVTALYCWENLYISEVINRNKEEFILIQISDFPMIAFRANLPDEKGEFNLVSLEYLGGNLARGWIEFTIAVLGTGKFTAEDSAAIFFINGEIEQVQITDGSIQRYETRITGEEALTALRNRQERVVFLANWMKTLESPDYQDINFASYWKPILFPELVSQKKKPDGWSREGDIFQRAESIRWNTSYTERVFPEELHNIRNSGTLLRDWEESLSWIYIQYEWDNIMELLSAQTGLIKIK